jgi:hypothetical protein
MQLTVTKTAADLDPSIRGAATTGISLRLLGHEIGMNIRGVPQDSLERIEAAELAAEARLREAADRAAALPAAVRDRMFVLFLEQI